MGEQRTAVMVSLNGSERAMAERLAMREGNLQLATMFRRLLYLEAQRQGIWSPDDEATAKSDDADEQ